MATGNDRQSNFNCIKRKIDSYCSIANKKAQIENVVEEAKGISADLHLKTDK